MKKISNAIALFCAAGTMSVALAADYAAGEKKAQEVCAACHGKDGNSATDIYPIIAGQHRDFLEKALRDYKVPTTPGVNNAPKRRNAIMAGFATTLTKQDIENVALYFSQQKSNLHTQY